MNKLSLNLWVSIALFVSATTVLVCSGCVEEERNGLLKLNPLFKTIPISWVDDEDSDCCGWERVLCDNNAPRRVIRLELNQTGGGSYYDHLHHLDASLFLPFQQLQHLDLSRNYISDLQNGYDLGKLKRLEVLILSWNSFDITRIFHSLSAITSLTVLDVSYNNPYTDQGVILDASLLLPLQQLQHLDLSGNFISHLQNGHDLGKLKKLEVLILSWNYFDITRIFRSLSAITSLTVLDLKNNIHHSDPVVILDASLLLPLQQLQHLDISGNSISHLQNGNDLGKLKKLEVLTLAENYFNITRILLSLSGVTSLTFLDLSHTLTYDSNHRVLDASLFLPFQQLQHLDLTGNYFTDLQNHRDLGKLKKLEVLILAYNYFNSTRHSQSLSALTSLTVLDLTNNSINAPLSDYGRGLCELKNLRVLDLSSNMLSGPIPKCFKNLTSIESLSLAYNNLLIGNLSSSTFSTSLEYLSLQNNQQFDANLMFDSSVEREFQFKYLDLSNCNLNTSTTDLVKFLGNQPNLMMLYLSGNNLHGELSSLFLKNSSRLKVLDIHNNSLTGHIHFPVGSQFNIELFDVSYNHIQGELQSNIGQVWPKLKVFNVQNNELRGEIPTSLTNMKDLEILFLANNELSGKLPERLGLGWERLKGIQLSNNKLEGQIPDTLFNLTELSFLDLSHNQFTGYIPSINFQLFSLVTFDISHNYISGRIPHWLGPNLTRSLQKLAMHNNYIQGYIPLELCNITSLRFLDLSQNQLSGHLPSCLTTMPQLQYLHLQHNKLTYPMPMILPLSESSVVQTLHLSHNNLSGEIPNWFGFLQFLWVLLLKGNRFSGSIPHELCRLYFLGIMDLSHNNLSGSIPLCFTNISFGKSGPAWGKTFGTQVITDTATLNTIHSDQNIPLPFLEFDVYIQGHISPEVVEFMVKSRSNSYEGDIIYDMYGMDLSSNNLNGSIPLDIGSLTMIRALNLSHNQLTGVIPSSLSNMKQIESIDLSRNKLSGEIPSTLTRLSFLAVFNVAYNNFSGRLPEMAAQFSTFNESSYEGNPFLCGPPLLGKPCNINADQATIKNTTLAGRIEMFGIDPISFFASFAAAYVTCLMGFVIVLYINPYWRRRWFRFITTCLRFVFPFWSEAIDRSEN